MKKLCQKKHTSKKLWNENKFLTVLLISQAANKNNANEN